MDVFPDFQIYIILVFLDFGLKGKLFYNLMKYRWTYLSITALKNGAAVTWQEKQNKEQSTLSSALPSVSNHKL